jgi:putative acetyltransferase
VATRIRPVRAGDFPALSRVVAAAFEREAEARLVAALQTAGNNAYELVAEREGRIVGHILFSPVTVERGDDGRALGLAPLAVAPEVQGQGIGSALARAALSTLATGPYRAVVVLGDPAYYHRFGFRSASAFGLDSCYAAGDDFMAMALKPDGLAGYGGRVTYVAEFDHRA